MVKDLLSNVLRIVKYNGICGNEDNLLVLLNIIGLRGVKNSHPVSSNLIVTGFSGTGKDFIFSTLCKLVLSDNFYIHRIYLTDKVFIYWKQMNWSGCVFYVEDPKSDLLVSSIFNTVASGGKKSSVVKNQKVEDIVIRGKPVIVITSMNSYVKVEGTRRWSMLSLEESPVLARLVLSSIAMRKEDGIRVNKRDLKYVNSFINLKFNDVVIPYKELLSNVLPNNRLSMTLFRKLLDFIRSSAVIHGRCVANWMDYEYGRFCFWRLYGKSVVPLNAVEREFLDVLDNAIRPLKCSEICGWFSHSAKWVSRNKDRLKELGVIEITEEYDEGSHRDVEVFSSVRYRYIDLPSSMVLRGAKAFNSDAMAFLSLLRTLDKGRIKDGLEPVFKDFLRSK